jgi:hypothetical protein
MEGRRLSADQTAIAEPPGDKRRPYSIPFVDGS